MTSRGPGLPQDPRNPFVNAAQRPPGPPLQQQNSAPQFPQPRRDYDTDSELGDNYGSYNSSTTRLAGSPGFYDQNGECSSFSFVSVLAVFAAHPSCTALIVPSCQFN